jgi:hypothetical protein
MPLVDYSSSSSEEEQQKSKDKVERSLPKLPTPKRTFYISSKELLHEEQDKEHERISHKLSKKMITEQHSISSFLPEPKHSAKKLKSNDRVVSDTSISKKPLMLTTSQSIMEQTNKGHEQSETTSLFTLRKFVRQRKKE